MKKLLLLTTFLLVLFSCSPEEETQAPTNTVEATTPETETVVVQYTLTATAGDGGNVTAGGTFDDGTSVSVTATANEGYEFIGWEGSDSTESSITVILNGDSTLTALFEAVIQYTLTVTAGAGLVSINGGRTYDENGPNLTSLDPNNYSIENPNILIGRYERRPSENGYHDVEIFSENNTLKWKTEAGYTWSLKFIGGDLWSGSDGVYDESKLGVYIDDEENVLAVVFNGENFDRVGDTVVTKVSAGTTLTVTYNSKSCNDFIGWEGIESNEETIEVTLNSNISINLLYNSGGEYSFNIDSSINGTVYEVLGDLENGTQFVEYTGRCFSEGEEIRLFAKPDDEYQFYGWKTSGMSNFSDGYIYDMNGNRVFKLGLDWGGVGLINLTPNFVEHHLWEDPLYSKLNMDSTPLDVVNVFLEEASQYGWDFEEKVEEIRITNGPGSYSKAICQENTYIDINIPIHDGPDSFTRWDFSSKMSVIYHELGHDLLNLNHICLPAHHMSGWDSCEGSESGLVGDISPMIYNGIVRWGAADLLYETEEEVLSWKRATRDMFELTGQDVKCEIE